MNIDLNIYGRNYFEIEDLRDKAAILKSIERKTFFSIYSLLSEPSAL